MLTFLTTRDHAYTLKGYLQSSRTSVPIKARSYDWLFSRKAVRSGTYVFTDLERLAFHELAVAARAFRLLKKIGMRVLNNPALALTRLGLLHKLHANKINNFQCYNAELQPQPEKFPVFIRGVSDHGKPLSDLIPDQATLDQKLIQLREDGIPVCGLLVIEFSAAPVRDKVYRKHSVFRCADELLSYTPIIEDSWLVKYGKEGLSSSEELDECVIEMDCNPFAERLRQIFEIAHIEYGRADFGLIDNQISVFEINTNPTVGLPKPHRHTQYERALRESLDRIVDSVCRQDSGDGSWISIPWDDDSDQHFPMPLRMIRLLRQP